jgi:glycosyltransferase involved in cell wall biosynthesis
MPDLAAPPAASVAPGAGAAGPPVAVLLAGKDPLVSIGGHGSYVRGHARALQQAGYEVHVFSLFPRAEERRLGFGTLHRVGAPVKPAWPWMLPFHVRPLARGVQAFVRGRGLRRVLIHAFALWGGVAIRAARGLRARGVDAEVVVSAYGPYAAEAAGFVAGLDPALGRVARLRAGSIQHWSRLAVEPSERRGYREAALVLVNYESVRRVLRARYGVDGRCRVVPYAPESAFLADAAPPDAGRPEGPGRPPLVVSVSRHDGRKGVNVLLRALARLREGGVRFRASLVGGGPLLAADRRLAARLGLGPGGPVAIEGHVPDPGAFLRRADVFALPSLCETSGSLALLEALQHGLPAVASACDGIPEDVEDGRSALLVPPGDAAALAGALARLLGDPALRERLGAGARRVFQERFAAGRLVAGLAEVYAELGFPPPRPVRPEPAAPAAPP